MKSLSIKILTALITFTLGVAIASLWLSRWFSPTIASITLASPAAPARLEMVFVLDTTGSMGGLIEGAKQKIWGIVNQVMQESHSSVRIGLVAYRDRGDEYVTQVLPLTDDLDKVYTTLMSYYADGGGDTEEDVRTALAAGLNNPGWSPAASDLSQIIFLVGDAPPHDDYNAPDTLVTAANAVQRGIIVNTVRCGVAVETERVWKAIAQHGNGQYFSIAQNGGVQAISTPYDEQLSRLANQLGSTFVAYGYGPGAEGVARRAAVAAEAAAVEHKVDVEAPMVAKAERAFNKAISSKAYIGDLLQNIENESVKLESVKPTDLPEGLRGLSPDELRQEIEKRLATRRDIRSQIMSLSQQRQAFIEDKRKSAGDKKDGFDEVVSKTLKEQMARKKK